MKTALKTLLLIGITLYCQLVPAQDWNTGGNNTTGGEILGCTTNVPLDLYTNTTQRVTIANGSGSTSGYVGIGNSFQNPASRLHIHQTGGDNAYFQITGNNTNATSTDGFRIGVINSSTATAQNVEIRQQEDAPMLLFTGSTGGTVAEAMRITEDDRYVGIGTTSPAARIHVKGKASANILKLETSGGSSFIEAHDSRYLTGTSDYIGSFCNISHSFGTASSDISSLYYVVSGTVPGGYNFYGQSFQVSNGATSGGPTYGIRCHSTYTGGGTGSFYGIYGSADAPSTGIAQAGTFVASGSGDAIGLEVKALSTGSTKDNLGITVLTYGNSGSGSASIGITSQAVGVAGGGSSTVDVYGVKSTAYWATGANSHNYGVYADVNTTAAISYGVYSTVNNTNCFAPACTSWSGYFVGDLESTGTIYGTISDIKLKNDVVPFTNAMNLLSQLNIYSFTYDKDSFPQLNLPSGSQYGVLAHEFEQVFPNYVKGSACAEVVDSLGNLIYPSVDYKTVSYMALIPLLVEAIKELDAELASLKTVSPKNLEDDGIKGSIELQNINRIILEQNDPNPFASRTVIKYEIPEEVNNASIVFVNQKGDVINTYVIKHSGKGELEVFGSKLNNGLYTYSLVVDGKIIESKKMVKAE